VRPTLFIRTQRPWKAKAKSPDEGLPFQILTKSKNTRRTRPNLRDKVFVEVPAFRGAWIAKRTDERLYRMIKGFREAGDLLVAESAAEPHRAMNLLYPVIFNYRQLRLKYPLMACGPHAGEMPDYRQHRLKGLWSKCRRVILFFVNSLESPDSIA
jgi:hypothetical protein